MRRFQKGQSIVEFALVLPLFFVLLWGIIYFGLLFADYLMLSNAARSSAREAALKPSAAAVTQVGKEYFKTCKDNQFTQFYVLQTFDIQPDEEGKDIVVTIKETRNKNEDANKVSQVINNFLETTVLGGYTIHYQMYWEGKSTGK
ncbi:MAG TPA: hypothetical protein DEA67_02500 [Selenomonas sp.]|nr:hypothetical protein [Selenomonas sp.]